MESIVENAVGGVIGMVVSRLKKEIRLAWGFKQELVELQREFTQLSMVVATASSGNNPLIAIWLNRVREVGEEANDLLDEWTYEVLRRQSLSSGFGRYMIMTFKYPITRLIMGHKLRNLSNTINSKVYAEAITKLGIRPAKLCNPDDGAGAGASTSQDPETAALFNHRQNVDYEFMVGRDEDVNQLVGRLCHPENYSTHLTVVGIVGMAGLGKTALSKKIINEARVTTEFNSIVWVVASGKPGVASILKKMAAKVCPEETKMEDREDVLNNELKKKLNGKRCLLILDDVWDSSWWEKSWGPLEKTLLKEIGLSKGSKVLVTSRQREVIQVMETHCYDVGGNWFIKKPTIHPLEELSDVKSRELLRKRLIRNVDNLVNDAEKTTLAENMLCKCGGVPLAIIALASLLIRYQSIHMWRKFDQDALWMEKEDESGILPSLKLSFNYLPSSSLKACFAFCGIFEEDEVIIKDKLICMWMAHGWLQSDNDEDEIMELKGEEYCKVLLNSSLLQEATKDRYGNVETFKMHDLVWSLARVVSKGECLCSNGAYDGSSQVRHLSLPGSTQELTLTSNTKLQTFCLYKYEARSLKFLKQCKHLRVLSIERIRDENWKWSMVESLKHLRYLSLDVNDFIEYWNRKQRSVPVTLD